jgi:hypothetical protein
MMRAIRQRIPISESVLVRLPVLTGLTFLLLGIGFLAPRLGPELTLVAVAAPPIVLLVINRLEYGVLAIVFTAAFVRFSLPTGTASRIVASLVLTVAFIALWLAKMLVMDRNLRLKRSSANLPLMGFIVTSVFSYVWSNAFRDPLVVVWRTWPVVQLGGLAMMILLPGAFLLIANSFSEVHWLKLLCGLLLVIGVFSLVADFFRIGLAFLNTGGLFFLCFVAVAYAQALFNKRLPVWLRLALLGMVGAWLYIYFVRRVGWLSGWMPSFIGLGLVSFFKSKKLLLIFVLLMIVFLGLKWDYYVDTIFATESEGSGDTRLDAWEHNWRVTGKHLLLGTGPAGYAAYYMSYFPGEAMATHSNYIDILSQTGIVGLFFCLWFFGALGWTVFRLCMRLKGTAGFSEGLAHAMLAAWAGCIVAMGLGDWMFPFVYTQTIAGFDYAVYSWVLLGGIVCLDNMCAIGEATEVGHG